LITNEDLIKEIGSEQLTQLSDLDAEGILNQDVIDDALNDAISLVESFIVPPDNPTKLLKKIVVDLTIYELRANHNLNSDEDKEKKKEAENYLLKMSTGKLRTEITNESTVTVPVENQSSAFRNTKRKRVCFEGYR